MSGDLFFNWTSFWKVLKSILRVILSNCVWSCLIIYEQILCFRTVLIVWNAISKWLKIHKPGCTHLLDFLIQIILIFWQKYLTALEVEIYCVEDKSQFLYSTTLNFILIYKMNVSTLFLVFSKRLELQSPDCTHFEDFLMKINFSF